MTTPSFMVLDVRQNKQFPTLLESFRLYDLQLECCSFVPLQGDDNDIHNEAATGNLRQNCNHIPNCFTVDRQYLIEQICR